MTRHDKPAARPREISSRSLSDRCRRFRARGGGFTPPWRRSSVRTGVWLTPIVRAMSLIDSPFAHNAQTFSCCSFDNPAMTPTIPYRWWCVDRLNSPSFELQAACQILTRLRRIHSQFTGVVVTPRGRNSRIEPHIVQVRTSDSSLAQARSKNTEAAEFSLARRCQKRSKPQWRQTIDLLAATAVNSGAERELNNPLPSLSHKVAGIMS